MRSFLEPIDYEDEDAGLQIVNDLHSTGFCVLKNHPATMDGLVDLRKRWRNWFEETNQSVKNTYEYDYTQAGYFSRMNAEIPVSDNWRRDMKEYFQVFADGFESLPVSLSVPTETHFKEMSALGIEILAMIDAYAPQSLGDLETRKCGSASAGSMSMQRVVYYPAMRSREIEEEHKHWNKACRAGSHTDVNLITLIPCNAEIGLQVWTEDWEWQFVPFDPNYLIVNAGDMLQEMSGGYFKSAYHRVVTPMVEIGSRLSLPFFVHPHRHTKINATETAGEFLSRRLAELGVAK